MPVYLCCELTARDLDSRLLIASHVLRAGRPVVVGQVWGIISNHDSMPKGVVLHATGNKFQAKGMAYLKASGHRVCFSDEEGLAVRDDELMLSHIFPSAVKYGDLFFYLHESHKALVTRVYPDIRGEVAGSPRVDLLRAPEIYRQEAQQHKERGPYILVNTNFSILNSVWGGMKGSAEDTARQQQNFVTITALIEWLVGNGWRVVVRPHPAENAENWANKGIEIASGGSGTSWTLGADLLIHPGSTTGLEAAFMGQPAINVGLAAPIYFTDQANFRTDDIATARTAIDAWLRHREGPIAAFRPTLPDIPSNAAGTIANALLKFVAGLPEEKINAWGRIQREPVQMRKFSAPTEYFAARVGQIVGNACKGITQLDDSLFLLTP